jgi:hypothetical protein
MTDFPMPLLARAQHLAEVLSGDHGRLERRRALRSAAAVARCRKAGHEAAVLSITPFGAIAAWRRHDQDSPVPDAADERTRLGHRYRAGRWIAAPLPSDRRYPVTMCPCKVAFGLKLDWLARQSGSVRIDDCGDD